MRLTRTVFPLQASLELILDPATNSYQLRASREKKNLHLLPDFLVIPFLPRRQSVIDRENQNLPLPLQRGEAEHACL